jgi:glycosyltransferase involved in cell wall biosynthesis
MKILVLSSLFPPDAIGGAELSAWSLTNRLAERGHDMAVLTTAKSSDEQLHGVEIDGVRVWRLYMPRPYPMFRFADARWWQKPIWHVADHLSPKNRHLAARVFNDFRPDFVIAHVLQGLGYNLLGEIARRDLPLLYVLHDQSLLCVRMAMFRNNKICSGNCVECRLSRRWKIAQLGRLRRLGLSTASRTNLETVARYLPDGLGLRNVLQNVNIYPKPTRPRTATDRPTFVYVGRIQENKGVHVLLMALERLSTKHSFFITIVGSGPSEAQLRARYGNTGWCRFIGHVDQQEVSNHIVDSDALCVPSIWSELLPGVAEHALRLGVPVIGSDIGGIPELVTSGKNGALVAPGDIQAWQETLDRVLTNPQLLESWATYAASRAREFEIDRVVSKYEAFISEISKIESSPTHQ